MLKCRIELEGKMLNVV